MLLEEGEPVHYEAVNCTHTFTANQSGRNWRNQSDYLYRPFYRGFVQAHKHICVAVGMRIACAKEEMQGLGTAGPLKAAEEMITHGTEDAPFIVVNSDVLCTYPLRDLLHLHIKHARAGTVLTTRCAEQKDASRYGVCVIDERTGRVRHFVDKPQTCAH